MLSGGQGGKVSMVLAERNGDVGLRTAADPGADIPLFLLLPLPRALEAVIPRQEGHGHQGLQGVDGVVARVVQVLVWQAQVGQDVAQAARVRQPAQVLVALLGLDDLDDSVAAGTAGDRRVGEDVVTEPAELPEVAADILADEDDVAVAAPGGVDDVGDQAGGLSAGNYDRGA